MSKTGYEQVGVNDIRSELRELGVDEGFLKNTKGILVDKLLELKQDNTDIQEDQEISGQMELPNDIFDETNDNKTESTEEDREVDNVFNNAEEEEDILYKKEKNEGDRNGEPEVNSDYLVDKKTDTVDLQPSFDSPQWHEYVIRQFEEDELYDGSPTCDGCRRVLENLIGPIVSQDITNFIGPESKNNGTATVSVRVSVHVINENHPMVNHIISCEEVADVNVENTDFPYNKYKSATAASRAEGRALRKLLRLKNVTVAEEVSEIAEEKEDGLDWSVDEPITDSQINVIDMLCNRLNIDAMEFINSGRVTYDDVFSIKKSTAKKMIQELNKIQRKVKEKPNINSYKKGWKDKTESVE